MKIRYMKSRFSAVIGGRRSDNGWRMMEDEFGFRRAEVRRTDDGFGGRRRKAEGESSEDGRRKAYNYYSKNQNSLRFQ